jgi:SPP1 family phage portal protein
MFDFTYELEQLREGNREPKIIHRLIKKHKTRADKMRSLYSRYKTEDVPIFKRTTDDPMEINNQVNNDFFSEIIDTKMGYFAGTPISYSFEDDKAKKDFDEFGERNRIADLDAETTKYAGICGYGSRLQYIDTEGREKMVNIKPWEAIHIGEAGIDEPEFSLRYFTVEVDENKKELRAELYESLKMTEYRGTDGKLELFDEYDHVYSYCPLWGYENNEELMGDAEKVVAAIDAYDRTMSDVNSEIEAFRSAYLAFFGVDPPNPSEGEEEPDLRKTGTFYFRNRGDAKQDAKFITKTIQDTAVENHLTRLHENIYRFSKTPDLSDKNFAGQQTGPAMKYKILALENKCATFERKFKSSSIRMFEILSSAFVKRGKAQIDPYKVTMHFKRNFPEDILNEAQASVQLKGIVSEETRLSKLSFIENAKEELKKLTAERAAYEEEFEDEEDDDDSLGGDKNGSGGIRKEDTKVT